MEIAMTRMRWFVVACGVAMAMLVEVPSVGTQAKTFELRAQEHIGIIGNTLAERMQYDGWLETMIQARFPKHQLTFRNLGFSGDEIATRNRSKNFGTPDEWLSGTGAPIGGYEQNRFANTNTKADVVFAFFGYNESYAGAAGLEAFKKQLGDWITHTLAQRYNGKTAPRIVVFSPIAHEDLGNPDLPDGKANNTRLAMYTTAMAEVSKAHNITFVDLYTPSLKLYASSKPPLTINGVHLNTEGNRRIAEVIETALFGAAPPRQEAYLTRLRQAVVDKDLYWFHRYRVTDGYSTYGDRAFLNFVRGTPRNVDAKVKATMPAEDILPTNYDTLQSELPVLDVMTRNRDRRVWAIASGTSLQKTDPAVSDSDTPPMIDAKTNFPKQPVYMREAESLKAMTIGAGFEVKLFASEAEFPELVKPVQIAFDTKGRLWVASWKSYPHWKPKTPMDDKLIILEDTNGDGKADKRTIFAGDLHNPTGFEFWNGGVLLAQQPNLVFLKDTNGDDKYDTKEILLHGFDSADTHHAINSFTFDPGGALYMREGVFHRTQVESPYEPTLRQNDGGVYRFEPRTFKIETYVPMNFPNPHGHVFDRWGRDIIFDATGGQPFYGPSFSTKKYFPAMETNRAPRPCTTPPCVRTRPVGGTDILSSRHFPEAVQGNIIVLNTIGFRGLLNYKFSEDGAGLKWDEVEPVLSSADENFRPVDAEVGPDGALYFADWQNAIVGHMQHNLRDTTRDHEHGRIYRVTAAGRPLLTPKPIFGQPVPALLELLKEPEDRVRYRAKIELSARDTREVITAVQAWADKLDPKDPQYEHHMMEALWLHQWHNRVNEKLLARMLQSPEPWARAAATRVLCYWRDRVANPLGTLRTLVNDPHPAVRLEAVRAASFFTTQEAAEVALLSLNHPQDRFLTYTLDQTMATLKRFIK
jgi:glucose/arabinose dehydrogenase/lysophospholipase L1-like esterase